MVWARNGHGLRECAISLIYLKKKKWKRKKGIGNISRFIILEVQKSFEYQAMLVKDGYQIFRQVSTNLAHCPFENVYFVYSYLKWIK